MRNSCWLLSSAGRRGALVEILRKTGGTNNTVVAVDASPLSAAGVLADKFTIVPLVSNPAFIDEVLEFAVQSGVNFVVPTIDPEISVYAEHKERFLEAGIEVFVSSPSVVELGWDKWKFAKWLANNRFPGPKTVEAHDLEGLQKLRGEVVAKPRNGSSSVGIIFANSAEDLPSDLSIDYIVQERVPGIEVTVDFGIHRDGSFIGAVPRRRLETRAGEVSKGVTIAVPELEEMVEQFANSLPGAFGVLNVQVFFDPATGDYSIIELNPRFGGGYPLSHAAGADLASAVIAKTPERVKWQPGVVMLRYDEGVYLSAEMYASNPWRA